MTWPQMMCHPLVENEEELTEDCMLVKALADMVCTCQDWESGKFRGCAQGHTETSQPGYLQ